MLPYRYICTLLLTFLCLRGKTLLASVKLSGTIKNRISDSIRISYNDNRLVYAPRSFTAVLDKKNRFSLTFPVPEGGYLQAELKHGNRYSELLLKDGDSLVLTADVDHFDSSVHYEGRGSAVQNFVVQHIIERGRMNQYALRIKNHMPQESAAFLKSISQEKQDELAFLEQNKKGLPVSFIKYWESFYTYYNYFFVQQYPQLHEMVRLRRYTDTIPEENYVVLQDMPRTFDDNMLQVPSYLLYLSGIFESGLKAAGYAHPVTVPENARLFLDSVNTLAYTELPSKSGEYFVAQSLYARIKRQAIENTRAEFAAFKKRWPQSEYEPLLSKQVATAERLQPGQPAPDLAITTADGRHLKLSDLKGKVVYMGFWAAWCKQCVGEMRSEQKVKDILKNKPVEFVYVSIDEDSVAAGKLMQQLKITGSFCWTQGGWYSPEVGMYGVQSLPAYFLIDRDGNFALQNPPTPAQSTELIVAISKLY